MTKSDSSKSPERTAGTDAGEWAKAVVDGMPKKAAPSAPSGPPPAAPLGNVTPDDAVAPDDVLDAIDTAALADAEDTAALADAEDTAALADAEVVEAEIVEPDSADGTGDIVDGSVDAVPGDVDDDGTSVKKEGEPISVEDLVIDLERVTTERDQYLDASRRLQAEFENYKKQVSKRESQARERANDSLIADLLPVMDAFDGAIANGAEDVAPMRTSFLDALAKQGLERIDPGEDPFDPNLHEAVMHDDDAETDGPVVAEVMRAGYAWKGRVLRPAMVRTRG